MRKGHRWSRAKACVICDPAETGFQAEGPVGEDRRGGRKHECDMEMKGGNRQRKAERRKLVGEKEKSSTNPFDLRTGSSYLECMSI